MHCGQIMSAIKAIDPQKTEEQAKALVRLGLMVEKKEPETGVVVGRELIHPLQELPHESILFSTAEFMKLVRTHAVERHSKPQVTGWQGRRPAAPPPPSMQRAPGVHCQLALGMPRRGWMAIRMGGSPPGYPQLTRPSAPLCARPHCVAHVHACARAEPPTCSWLFRKGRWLAWLLACSTVQQHVLWPRVVAGAVQCAGSAVRSGSCVVRSLPTARKARARKRRESDDQRHSGTVAR